VCVCISLYNDYYKSSKVIIQIIITNQHVSNRKYSFTYFLFSSFVCQFQFPQITSFLEVSYLFQTMKKGVMLQDSWSYRGWNWNRTSRRKILVTERNGKVKRKMSAHFRCKNSYSLQRERDTSRRLSLVFLFVSCPFRSEDRLNRIRRRCEQLHATTWFCNLQR